MGRHLVGFHAFPALESAINGGHLSPRRPSTGSIFAERFETCALNLRITSGKPRLWRREQQELVGGFNPSEKYESQLGWWLSNIWKAWKAYKSHEHVVTSESLPEKLKRIRVSMPRKQPFFTLREHNPFSNNTKLGSGIPWLDLGHIIGA